MTIEGLSHFELDQLKNPAEFSKTVEACEEKKEALVVLSASVSIESLDRVVLSLMALRASNISAILQLKKPESFLEDDELVALFGFLKEWDQLFLFNFMEICGDWVPADFQAALTNEAKIEVKWAREWLTANSDPKIYKYPSLPWRSFLRKIIGENHGFVARFLELTTLPGTPENIKAMTDHIKAFLEAKKKVVCVFPKKWGTKGESAQTTH